MADLNLRPAGKVVVTGAAGFIGSYLAKMFLRRGLAPSELFLVDEEDFFLKRKCAEGLVSLPIGRCSSKKFIDEIAAGQIPKII